MYPSVINISETSAEAVKQAAEAVGTVTHHTVNAYGVLLWGLVLAAMGMVLTKLRRWNRIERLQNLLVCRRLACCLRRTVPERPLMTPSQTATHDGAMANIMARNRSIQSVHESEA